MPVEKEVAAQEFVQGIKNGSVWVVSISRPIIFDISPFILGALRGGRGRWNTGFQLGYPANQLRVNSRVGARAVSLNAESF